MAKHSVPQRNSTTLFLPNESTTQEQKFRVRVLPRSQNYHFAATVLQWLLSATSAGKANKILGKGKNEEKINS